MAQRADFVSETAVRIMMRYQWAMVLYYSVHIIECNEPYCPTLMINGPTMWVNPVFWKALTRDQRVTAILHELWHKGLLHNTRMGSRDPNVWNEAGDHVINIMLTKSKCTPLTNIVIPGTRWDRKNPFNWCCDMQYDGKTTEQVYDLLMKKYQGQKQNPGQQSAKMIGPMKDVLPFGKDGEGNTVNKDGDPIKDGKGQPIDIEVVKEFERGVRSEMERARTMAKMAGKGSIDFDAVIGAMNHVKIPWQDELFEYLTSFSTSEFSYDRYERRAYVVSGFIAPDRYTPAMGGILVSVDESGSTLPSLPLFKMHFQDIVRMLQPEWVEVLYHTDQILGKPERFERGEVDIELRHKGTGGTSFKPTMDYIEEMAEKPAVVICLTDLEGDNTEEDPGVPVVWACSEDTTEHKFGRVISIQ